MENATSVLKETGKYKSLEFISEKRIKILKLDT